MGLDPIMLALSNGQTGNVGGAELPYINLTTKLQVNLEDPSMGATTKLTAEEGKALYRAYTSLRPVIIKCEIEALGTFFATVATMTPPDGYRINYMQGTSVLEIYISIRNGHATKPDVTATVYAMELATA